MRSSVFVNLLENRTKLAWREASRTGPGNVGAVEIVAQIMAKSWDGLTVQ
jgi:hypothetical protein